MGKSGKKIKSDRINALRKQYDAFLDEDKKRKDRNEFILGRLEKMRLYTPSLLPVRYNMEFPQPYHYVNQDRPDFLRKIKFDDNKILCSRSKDVLSDCVLKDEQEILQEISKKYILIPKLRSKNETNVSYFDSSNVSNDDGDWRKKYNILNDLKKIEKEGSSEVTKDSDNIVYDTHNVTSINREKSDLDSGIATSEHVKELDTICNAQLKNDNVPVDKLQTDSTKTELSNDNYNMECKTILENKQDLMPPTKEKIVTPVSYPPTQQVFSDLNLIKNENAEKINYMQGQDVKQKEMTALHNSAQIKTDSINKNVNNIRNEPVSQNNIVEPSNESVIDPNITVAFEKELIDQTIKADEIDAHNIEHIENLEACASIDQDIPVSENIQQPEYESNDTRIDENVIPSQIDEFEAEQKGMFYSEETEYNQNVDNMGYNTQNEEYVNEQYSYYNEPQQEQPYYGEINEHEESTERYDPNYEQQYVENNQENVNVAHYENQPYAEGYENEQMVTNINYEQPYQQEITNVNYENQPDPSDPNVNYEQQPVDYGYEHTANTDQSQMENITYDTQVSEPVNYEAQQYDENEDQHHIIPNQNEYENQQDYVQMHTEQEIQNLEQQLDGEDGYTEIQNTYPNEHAAVENTDVIESNIKAT